MRRKKSALELIAAEYSDAIAAGEFERAEGWFAVARFAATREVEATVEEAEVPGDLAPRPEPERLPKSKSR
jgi:hypothetical protein